VTHGLITLNLEGDLFAIFRKSKESQPVKFLAAAGAGLGLSVIASVSIMDLQTMALPI
jgi:hypothetical protein